MMTVVAVLALLVVCLGALWLVLVGLLCAAAPARALHYLSKMGSSLRINLAELVPRGLIGLAMIARAPDSKAPFDFTVLGGFLAISAVVILLVPRARHNAFAASAAQIIPVWTVRWFIAPISVGAGILLGWAAF